MARFVSPITDIKPNGSVSFFDSNTNAPKITYKDDVESIQNLLTIPVNANGNLPNIFFSGSAAVIYLDEFGVQYAARNPVGGERELGDFSPWDAQVSYDLNDIVEGSDGNIYRSLSSGNIGNDPTLTPTQWEEIRFIGVWNTNITYAIGDVVQTSNGNLWKALTVAAGIDPETDSGTNWLPSVDDSKLPRVKDSNIGAVSQSGQFTDWDDILINGMFFMVNGSANQPASGVNWQCLCVMGSNGNNLTQTAFSGNVVYTRSKLGTVWGEWLKVGVQSYAAPTTSTYSRLSNYTTFTLSTSGVNITLDDSFLEDDVVEFNKVLKTTTHQVGTSSAVILDEDNVNIGNSIDLLPGDSLTMVLLKVGANWRMRVY